MKVAIVASRIINELDSLRLELEKRGHSAEFWPLDQLKPSDFVLGVSSVNFSAYDLIYYRSGFTDAGKIFLPNLLGDRTDKLVNPVLYKHPLCSSKLYQSIMAEEEGLKFPATYMGRNISFGTLEKEIGVPFIAKNAIGIQGKQVFLIENKEQYEKFIEKNTDKDLLIQKFIPNRGDYRVFMIGGEVHEIFKRVAPDGDFKNNMSRGARGELVTNKDLREHLGKMAKVIVDKMDIEIGGVDIIESSEDGELYFLEVNVNPGWSGLDQTLGTNTAAAIVDYFESRIK